MFSIGDFALNQKTGKFGKVIGYGHQMLNDVYETTLKVLVIDAMGYVERIEEDTYSAWKKLDEANLLQTQIS
jgi:hypothetical protein